MARIPSVTLSQTKSGFPYPCNGTAPASAPVASAPVASAPVASAPVASAPVASAPVASAPAEQLTMANTKPN